MKLAYIILRNNKLIPKTQQRFKSERHNVFTEELNKIALSSYEHYTYGSYTYGRKLYIWNEQRSSK